MVVSSDWGVARCSCALAGSETWCWCSWLGVWSGGQVPGCWWQNPWGWGLVCGSQQGCSLVKVGNVEALVLSCRVSSVLNRNSRQFGKKHLFDQDEETCWNSDQVRRLYTPPFQLGSRCRVAGCLENFGET